MNGYITVCYSDQNQEIFKRGVMRIRNGVKTEEIIQRPLRKDDIEGENYYIKTDPNFDQWTYSICHKSLRKVLSPKDILFFRTLWRGNQYFIGYFTISHKSGDGNNPVCYADLSNSFLINGYKFVITPKLVEILNDNADYSKTSNKKRFVSGYLSRCYLHLSADKTEFLKKELDKFRQHLRVQ